MSSKVESPCAGILGGHERARRRLVEVLGCASELSDYRKLLLKIQQMPAEARATCYGLAVAVTDRAFEAETYGRVMIKHMLDSVNEMRDEGRLYDGFERAARELAGNGTCGIVETLRRETDRARGQFGEAGGAVLAEVADALEAMDLEFSIEREALLVQTRKASPGEEPVRLATTRKVMQAGRVGSTEFFEGRNGRAFLTPAKLYAPIDCHHRPLVVGTSSVIDTDLYAAMIGGLATLKSQFYQQARRIAELGPRGLRGEAPVVAAAIAAIVVGIVVATYGLATGNSVIFYIGAALVAVGGAALGLWQAVFVVAA